MVGQLGMAALNGGWPTEDSGLKWWLVNWGQQPEMVFG
jgi:hypothetical protein